MNFNLNNIKPKNLNSNWKEKVQYIIAQINGIM